MGAGSFLEVYTTVFGWLLYDNVWSVLAETGIAYIPFFTVVIKNFAEPYKSQEAKDAASVSQRRMELDIIAMFIAIIIAVTPSINLPISSQKYKAACTTAPAVTGGATGTTFDGAFPTASLGGSVAQIPIWWYMVMNLSGALNDTVIAGMNCAVDIRQVKYEINNIQIQDQGLRDDLGRFHNECYLEALAVVAEDPSKFQTSFNAGAYDSDDREWVGSNFLIADAALYPALRAQSPVANFPYVAARDIEYDPAVGVPTNGRPTCSAWWTDSTNGLEKRLQNEIPASKNATIGAVGTLFGNTLAEEREDAIKTVLLNSDTTVKGIERMRLDGLKSVGQAISSGDLVGGTITNVAGTASTVFAWAFVETALITIKNMAPNLQALILMTIYFLLPFVFVMSSYDWKVIILATFTVFGIRFLTTIFALLTLLDTTLFAATNKFSLDHISNSLATATIGKGIIDLSIAAMWIIMPGLWLSMIGWAGFKAAASVATGTKEAKSTGDKGTEGTKQVGTKAAGGK